MVIHLEKHKSVDEVPAAVKPGCVAFGETGELVVDAYCKPLDDIGLRADADRFTSRAAISGILRVEEAFEFTATAGVK